ncbi:CLUMA_CG006353, isoform A [Clunio marinus]|uniref:CLUMA_CG006353, isoform A n=1 Tax=Clunio marinus TaxID=568069 RepID=A0A1J1HY22_9DIPT|nr:CLUMA_CG006353, isoform A [Clunio marinus]
MAIRHQREEENYIMLGRYHLPT